MKNRHNKQMVQFVAILIFLLASFIQASATKISVKAKGSKSHGIYAHFTVLVNGVECGDRFTSSSIKEYSFAVPFSKEEIKEIRIVFDNDHYCIGEDRNLFVLGIQIEESDSIIADEKEVKYFCINGKELEYEGMMGWNGSLVFDLESIDKNIYL